MARSGGRVEGADWEVVVGGLPGPEDSIGWAFCCCCWVAFASENWSRTSFHGCKPGNLR